MDRMLAVYAGSPGFDSHRRHMPERFFRSNRSGYPHQVCSELEKVVLRWRLVIAVSMNVGGSVRLIKPTKLYMCTQTLYKHNGDGRTVRDHGSVLMGHQANGVTRIGFQQQLISKCLWTRNSKHFKWVIKNQYLI